MVVVLRAGVLGAVVVQAYSRIERTKNVRQRENMMAENHNTDFPTDPNLLMRQRRPEQFSDTVLERSARLSPEELEHYLDKLTSRRQENAFETLCKRLVERRICPNVRPQTGPVGGGDSKADSETVPVSSEVTNFWIGYDPKAATERWAFAFSAKKQWQPKVRSDCEGLYQTKRPYKRVYFITNQYARDKKRAEIEDQLTRDLGFEVYILDRNWLIQSIFDHKNVDVAVDAFGLSRDIWEHSYQQGPRDTSKLQEIGKLEDEINYFRENQIGFYHIVENAIRICILSRELEKPRHEIDGYLARAERLSLRYGNSKQQLRVAYEKCWTAIWWFSDFSTLNDHYPAVEKFALDSDNSDDIEKLFNIWCILSACVRAGTVEAGSVDYEERTNRLENKLATLSSDNSRPNNALEAHSMHLFMRMQSAINDGNKPELRRVVQEFESIVSQARYFTDYSVERFLNLFEELSSFLPDIDEMDSLFDSLGALVRDRRGAADEGALYHQRGMNKISADKPYEAIRLFGKAQGCFVPIEYRDEFVRRIIGMAIAYESVGLYWAARNKALAGLERCLADLNQSGSFDPITFGIVEKIAWLEIRLGRIPQILQYVELERGLIAGFSEKQQTVSGSDPFEDSFYNRDAVIGCLLTNLSMGQLKELEALADVFEDLELYMSRFALLFGLGHIQQIYAEGYVPKEQFEKDIEDTFKRWRTQPAHKDVAASITLLNGNTGSIESNILGCQFTIKFVNTDNSLIFSEALISAFEELFATGVDQKLAIFKERCEIFVEEDSSVERFVEFDGNDTSSSRAYLVKINDWVFPDQYEDRERFQIEFFKVVLQIGARIAHLGGDSKEVERFIHSNSVLLRLGTAIVLKQTYGNIFGQSWKVRGKDWTERADLNFYDLLRDRLPPGFVPDSEGETGDEAEHPRSGGHNTKDRTSDSFSAENVSHRDMRVLSLIDNQLWDRAQWCATVVMEYEGIPVPLGLGLGFKDESAAREIFTEWNKRLGQEDSDEILRVSIIKGVEKTNPHAYNVVVSTNWWKLSGENDPKWTLSVSRVNSMTPMSSKNLDMFEEKFKKYGTFMLVAVKISEDFQIEKVIWDRYIIKKEINIREVKDIGGNDPDWIGVRKGNDANL